MKQPPTCELAKGFSLREKVVAQSTFIVMGVTGTTAILLEDWRLVFPYLLLYWYGIPGVIMRHLNCPRCPHLHVYGDCLQAPARIAKWLVIRKKTNPFTKYEKRLFFLIFIMIPIYPLYFLISHQILAVVFALSAICWYAGQLFYFCKRCKVESCPFNRVPKTIEMSGNT